MKCPYCGGEMDSGRISSGRDTAVFIADNAKRKLGIFYENIKITNYFDSPFVAYHCEVCEKIIIDLKHKEWK